MGMRFCSLCKGSEGQLWKCARCRDWRHRRCPDIEDFGSERCQSIKTKISSSSKKRRKAKPEDYRCPSCLRELFETGFEGFCNGGGRRNLASSLRTLRENLEA